MNVVHAPEVGREASVVGVQSHTTFSTPQVLPTSMDFASPVAPSIAGEPSRTVTTGKTFATWTFNTAKNPFAAQWRTLQFAGADRRPGYACGYREHHHPSATGEGLRP